MTKVTKSITIPVEIWLAFEEKHPGENFSRWVSKRLARELKLHQNKRLITDDDLRCKNSSRYKGIKITKEMCESCGVAECEDRLE